MNSYLLIQIDVDEDNCGKCPCLRPIRHDFDVGYCNVLNKRLTKINNKFKRCKTCLDCENREAKTTSIIGTPDAEDQKPT